MTEPDIPFSGYPVQTDKLEKGSRKKVPPLIARQLRVVGMG